MGYKLLTQIVLFIISIVIVVIYIKPQFFVLSNIQSETDRYTVAADKATDLNSSVSKLVQQEKDVALSNKQALDTYIPFIVDEASVMATIIAIADSADMTLLKLSVDIDNVGSDKGVFEGEEESINVVEQKDFNVDSEGTYESLKLFLQTLEQNQYPLEVVKLTFDSTQKDEIDENEELLLEFVMTLRTYSYLGYTTN